MFWISKQRRSCFDALHIRFLNVHIQRRAVYELTVTARPDSASTNPLSGTAQVIINVVDLNDNSPVFTFPSPTNDTLNVSSATPVGHVVARLAARDDDAGDNGRLTFGCRPATTRSVNAGGRGELGDYDTVDDAFSVSADYGDVTVSRSLTDVVFRVYYIPLYVVDSGQPVRSGSGTLRIVVDRTIPFNGGGGDGAGGGRSSPGDLLALLSRRDGLLVYVAVAVAAGCCLLVTAPLATSLMMRRRRRQRRHADRSSVKGADRVDGDVVQPTDSLMGSAPPPSTTDVAGVRAVVSPFKHNGVVPASHSLHCLTNDVDVRTFHAHT